MKRKWLAYSFSSPVNSLNSGVRINLTKQSKLVSLKNMGPVILCVQTAHRTQTLQNVKEVYK